MAHTGHATRPCRKQVTHNNDTYQRKPKVPANTSTYAFAWIAIKLDAPLPRLRLRYEKRTDIHTAILIIGCLLICYNRVVEFC